MLCTKVVLADTSTTECVCQKDWIKYDTVKEHTKPDTCTIDSSKGSLVFYRQIDEDAFVKYTIEISNSNRVSCRYEHSTSSSIFKVFKHGGKKFNHISNFSLAKELTAKDAINHCAKFINKNISDSNACAVH
jgi:hypothetical protein